MDGFGFVYSRWCVGAVMRSAFRCIMQMQSLDVYVGFGMDMAI